MFLNLTSPLCPDDIDTCFYKQQAKENVAAIVTLREYINPLSSLPFSNSHLVADMMVYSKPAWKLETKPSEVVKDICNELEVRSLCHKILQNVSMLLHADRGSLFLVQGRAGRRLHPLLPGQAPRGRCLVSKLFDVCSKSTLMEMEKKEEIRIPWGTGIVGYVAESGESVNIPDAYQRDSSLSPKLTLKVLWHNEMYTKYRMNFKASEVLVPICTLHSGRVIKWSCSMTANDGRFNHEVDALTGYRTKSLLCMPIKDTNGDVIGVAQVINKVGDQPFTKQDEEVFSSYLQFCGIGLRNAHLYEKSQLEIKRNQVLLDLARMIFEEQSTIEHVVFRILTHTQGLIQCQRVQVSGSVTVGDLVEFGSINLELPSLDVPPAGPQISPIQLGTKLWKVPGKFMRPSDKRVLLVHQGSKISFSRVFDFEASDLNSIEEGCESRTSPFESRFPINVGITGYVATTGETVNLIHVEEDPRFDASVDEGTSFRHKTLLCMAIKNSSGQIIGVIQLINKFNDLPFTKNDENFVEAFAIFCGMGIHNTHMYEKAIVAIAKQNVTLEVLSYHATASLEDAQRLRVRHQVLYSHFLFCKAMHDPLEDAIDGMIRHDLNSLRVPSAAHFCLHNFAFDDIHMDDDETLTACIRMFLDLDLVERFHMDYEVLCRWLLSVKKNYRNVTYHNWRHAFNVAQMMFSILTVTQWWNIFGEIECLALMIACLCHDLDHRGTNNSFQIKASSPLAQLYSTSTMEHHHFDQCIMILNSPGNQLLSNISPEEYSRVIRVLEEAILSTDLAVYFRKRGSFFKVVAEGPCWALDEHRDLLRAMLMTVCDLAAITKPWEVEKRVAGAGVVGVLQSRAISRGRS
ncbi:hypothetical protein NQ317_015757 [Molorchus minor]|uniref:Phosphodiesterase n=1 Tax=Molorchus minor TaxID=1323400 RepID=A0ABQ9K279_9CUCU|nr:hypothetical protein NQ317_015757 [Molorchus minor]